MRPRCCRRPPARSQSCRRGFESSDYGSVRLVRRLRANLPAAAAHFPDCHIDLCGVLIDANCSSSSSSSSSARLRGGRRASGTVGGWLSVRPTGRLTTLQQFVADRRRYRTARTGRISNLDLRPTERRGRHLQPPVAIESPAPGTAPPQSHRRRRALMYAEGRGA